MRTNESRQAKVALRRKGRKMETATCPELAGPEARTSTKGLVSDGRLCRTAISGSTAEAMPACHAAQVLQQMRVCDIAEANAE